MELEIIIRRTLEGMLDKLYTNPPDIPLLSEVRKMIELIRLLPFSINLWQAQNIYYKLSKITYKELLAKAKSGNEEASLWVEKFKQIGQGLFFNVETILPQMQG